METVPTLNELVAVNLQYVGGAEALNVRAVAQLLAKVLYSAGRLVSRSPKDLASEAAGILGIKKISEDQVDAGLSYLKANLRFAKESHGKWLLTDSGLAAIERDVQKAEERRRSILRRHFPDRIDRTALTGWFVDACVGFYGIYGSQWAATLARKTPPPAISHDQVKGLLDSTTARRRLESESGSLTAGFHSFISSQHPEDVEENWSLCQALLAAKLVAANVGPDPITAKEFHGTLLLLDTNALLVTALEGHHFAGAFEKLGKVLATIGARLGYIEDTKEEYTRVVAARRSDVRKAIAGYSLGVISGSGDAFLDTAVERRCSTEKDVDRFFDKLLDPPKTLGSGVPIEVVNDEQAVALANRGRADVQLQNDITKIWQQHRQRPKSPRAAEHDAALTAVVEGLRKQGQRCSVVTLDQTMHIHSLRRVGPHALPQWIGLDALVQILAVDNAGPTLDPTDFGPLMAAIIRKQSEPMLDTYTAEDLAIMLDIEAQIAELSPDRVKQIATQVGRARLRGKAIGASEMALVVRRAFQITKLAVSGEAAELAGRLELTEGEVRGRDAQLRLQARQQDAVGQGFLASRTRELERDAHFRGARDTAVGLVGAGVLGYAAYWLVNKLIPGGFGAEWLHLFLAVTTFAIAILGWVFTAVLPRWRRDVADARRTAEEELRVRIVRAGSGTE